MNETSSVECKDFPRLAAAVARMVAAGSRHTCPRSCATCEAYKAGNDVAAKELLPAILGGEWALTERGYVLISDQWGMLLDHRQIFRRKGARGAPSWDDYAVVAHPYHVDSYPKRMASGRAPFRK
jgi:hypothetical protein